MYQTNDYDDFREKVIATNKDLTFIFIPMINFDAFIFFQISKIY